MSELLLFFMHKVLAPFLQRSSPNCSHNDFLAFGTRDTGFFFAFARRRRIYGVHEGPWNTLLCTRSIHICAYLAREETFARYKDG